MPAIELQSLMLEIPEPFPGLRSFTSDEEVIFCGRQKQTDDLLQRLAEHRFLAVVGTSGSGKSSLVRAGLLPALERGYLEGATSRWRIAVMRPGMAPIENLLEALRGEDAQQASIQSAKSAALRSSSLGLVEVVQDAKLKGGESLLIVVDQFEEVFRYSQRVSALDSRNEAAHLVNLLLRASERPDVPIFVVLTMRSDFLGDCARFPGLPEALSRCQYLIPRLTREQRRQAITEPLNLFGATVTPQLVEQLLNDSGDEPIDSAIDAGYRGGAPDTLPVLQHALMRTYVEWKSLPENEARGPIDLAQYRRAGCMEAALNQHAESLFAEDLDDDGRRWAERIFRCLTTTELGRPVRRPTLLADLYEIVGAKEKDRARIEGVLAVFCRRENSFVQMKKDGSVDILHECLIWKWKRLSGWVADEAESAELYRDLVKDALGEATWGESKVSAAIAVRGRNAWNANWAGQYSVGRFEDVERFLTRSQIAAGDQRRLRRFGFASLFVLIILAITAYYSGQNALRKAKELHALQIVRDGLAKDLDRRKQYEDTLSNQISALNRKGGATLEERDQIASEKAALEAQLLKSTQESQKLSAQAQQSSTDLLANVKTLQIQLAAAQREREDAVKARLDAEVKVGQLAKELEGTGSAATSRAEAATSSKDRSTANVGFVWIGMMQVDKSALGHRPIVGSVKVIVDSTQIASLTTNGHTPTTALDLKIGIHAFKFESSVSTKDKSQVTSTCEGQFEVTTSFTFHPTLTFLGDGNIGRCFIQ